MFKNCKNVLTIVLLMVAPLVAADTAFNKGQFQPFDQVMVEETELAMSVKDRVLYFAHFTCPYCRQAHQYLDDWGNGLPAPYRMEIVPAVGLKEHIPMALAYYAVLQINPGKLEMFQQAMFSGLQDKGRSPTNAMTFKTAAKVVGIDVDEFTRMIASEATKRYVERAYRLTSMFSVQEVPTVVVANTYKTAPGRVYNEREAFLTILNGLVSMHHRESR